MKKIFITILFLFMFAHVNITVTASEAPHTLVIHYYRYDEDYSGFNFHMWKHRPTSIAGIDHYFDQSNIGEYGIYHEVDLNTHYPDATMVGIIIKQGSGWSGYKEIGGDRFIDLEKIEVINGVAHAYFVEQDINIGLSQADLADNIPDYRDRILMAAFDTQFRVSASLTAVPEIGYEVLENNLVVAEGTASSRNLLITIPNVDISKQYILRVMFTEQNTSEFFVSLQNVYDTPEFESQYTYTGNLGVSFEEEFTIFRLWAPLSEKVTLNLYHQGHPDYNDQGQPNEEKTPFIKEDMVRIENGAWEARFTEDLTFKYYTFSVTNNGVTHEVTDPYAYSTGANGQRGMVVDFEQLNPEGWTYGTRPNTVTNPTDYIIYELHVRDLTTHSSWQGTESYRGRFMGLTERGTTYTHSNGVTVTTGLDHILELGVNAVQFIPIFDFGYVDEIEMALNPNYTNTFNWGYMPYHFNTLEGSYSSNPFDGRQRIIEFKQVVQTFHEHDLRIIMDVVYNHTGESETSNFHRIVPGYYHRLTPTGGFSNGSGTGNEVASERSMARKFMLDSLEFWTTEYNFSGYRFDLMELHDVETMNQIAAMLEQIDPTIIIFGEPWMGGDSPLPNSMRAGKGNMDQMPSIGAFNDITRDGIKGSVFQAGEPGWVQGDASDYNVNRLKYGISGGTMFAGDVGGFHTYPTQMINYATAHDNNTLFDKFMLTGFRIPRDVTQVKGMQIQANAIVLTSQGVPFIHAGVEFMRSKPDDGTTKSNYVTGGFVHNSYESSDAVNQLRWDRKAQYNDVFEYYKALIEIRKSYSHFRMTDASEINQRLSFLPTDAGNHGIAYEIKGLDNEPDIIVVHSGNPQFGLTGVSLPAGKSYHVLTYTEDFNLNGLYVASSMLFVPSNTTAILVEVTESSVEILSPLVEIQVGETFDPLANVDVKPGANVTLHASNYHDVNRPGLYTITVSVTESYGKVTHHTYTLHVTGRQFDVTVEKNQQGGQ